jgi:hypothetical protein
LLVTAGKPRDGTHSVFRALANSLVTDTRIFQLPSTWITESVIELEKIRKILKGFLNANLICFCFMSVETVPYF